MAQIRLINHTGQISSIGKLVRLDPNDSKAFIYATPGLANILGTITQRVPSGYSCVINLLNTVDWSDVINAPTNLGGGGASNIDGGSASSIYSNDLTINGGNA